MCVCDVCMWVYVCTCVCVYVQGSNIDSVLPTELSVMIDVAPCTVVNDDITDSVRPIPYNVSRTQYII